MIKLINSLTSYQRMFLEYEKILSTEMIASLSGCDDKIIRFNIMIALYIADCNKDI